MSEFFRYKSIPTVSSAKMQSNSYSVDNVAETFWKQVLPSPYKPGKLGRALTMSSKNFKKLESFENGTKTSAVSDSNDESSKETIESAVYKHSTHTLNQEVLKSSDPTVQDAYRSLNSGTKVEQSPERLELDVSTDEDAVDGELTSGSSSLSRTRSFQANTDSSSSSDQEQQDLVPQLRKAMGSAEILRAFGPSTLAQRHYSIFSCESSRDGDQARKLQSLQRLIDSESTLAPPSIPQSKVAEELVKFCHSERGEQVKILQEVDELKVELQRLLTKTASGNEASAFSMKVTRFKGKLPSEKHRSSLIPLAGEPKTSAYKSCGLYQEKQVLPPKHERAQPIKRHTLPFLGGAPFVICCRCYKLLQLPADFLVSMKRVHKLRCGACSEVLKYTFRRRTRALEATALKH